MKTTLRYNTIEALQRQKNWKKFLNTIVDDCCDLYDDNLVAEVDTQKDGLPITKLKLSDTNEELRAKYAVLSYLNNVMHLNLHENISLRGLLRVLSLYGCKIKDVEQQDSVLPHTFKVEGSKRDTAVWGFKTTDRSYDYEARGIRGDESQTDDEYTAGDVEVDYFEHLTDKNFKDEDTTFKYIYNVFGYNQKNPILSVSKIKEVKSFYVFERTSSEGGLAALPETVYVESTDVTYNSDSDYGFYVTTAYTSSDSQNSGVTICDLTYEDENENVMDANSVLSTYYEIVFVPDTDPQAPLIVQRWVCNKDAASYLRETSYILNDNDKIDLIKENERIKYNSEEKALDKYLDVRFALSETANIEKVDLIRIGVIGENDSPTPSPSVDFDTQKKYFVYEDTTYHRQWVVMDTIEQYSKVSIIYLLKQLFSDECALKAQPLFLYKEDDTTKASMCANFIDSVGGVDKITFEVEKYDINKMLTTYASTTNLPDDETSTPTEEEAETIKEKNKVQGVYYGDYFFKWEQFGIESNLNDNNSNKGFYYKDVYTLLNFDKLPVPETQDRYDSLDFFFDGSDNLYFIDKNKTDYQNNQVKELDGRLYENTFRQDFIETMFFNHFIKVYPITKYKSDSLISTTRLYCDNLELVEFGGIIPYIVSYDRRGELNTDENSEEVFNDLDCSIFSKIVSYNKHTHLITVNNPVFFENSYTPKYVVVAYQNASPFNKIQTLNITAPSLAIKNVVSDFLKEYVNTNYELNLFTEAEYKDYVDEQFVDRVRKENDTTVDGLRNTLRLKYNSSKLLFGTYDLQLDKSNTPIVVTVLLSAGGGELDITAVKSNGNFELVSNSEVLLVKEFKSGQSIITSIYFGDKLKRQQVGNNLFDKMGNLKVIDNFNPKSHASAHISGTVESGLWWAADFSKTPSLLYFNAGALGGLTHIKQSLDKCPMFRGSKIRIVDFSKIRWSVSNTLIDFNFDYVFENCSCLESVNFKLQNGNKFRAVSMIQTFRNCEFLHEIDLSDIDMSLVGDLSSAFEGCKRLKTVKIDWGENSVANKKAVKTFKDCRKLEAIEATGTSAVYGTSSDSATVFIGWSGNIDTDRAFENCESLKELVFPTALNVSRTPYVSMLTNCGAERIGFNVRSFKDGDSYGIRDIVKVEMPNLKTIEYCDEWFDWRLDDGTIKLWIDTPNLTRASFMTFIRKQFVKENIPEGWVESGFNIYVNPHVLERLNVGTDIVPAMTDNNGSVICYELVNHTTEGIKIYPSSEDVVPLVSIKTNLTSTVYKATIDSLDNVTVTLTVTKKKNQIDILELYANGNMVHQFDVTDIRNGGTVTYTFDEPITDTIELKAFVEDTVGLRNSSTTLKYKFNYPRYSGLITVSGEKRMESGRIVSYALDSDLTAAAISALNADYYQNSTTSYNQASQKLGAFAVPKYEAPNGAIAIVSNAYGSAGEDKTEYWLHKEMTINGIDYIVYYMINNYDGFCGFYNFIIE